MYIYKYISDLLIFDVVINYLPIFVVSFYSELAKGSLFSVSSYKKGISQIMYSPCGNYLFFSERKVSESLSTCIAFYF